MFPPSQHDPPFQLFPKKNIQTSKRAKPTLNSSLSADGRGQTHSTGHKVGEDLVGARRLLVGVFAEIGDLQGRVFGRAKGALEGRRLGGISDTSLLLLAGGEGDSGRGGRQLLASANAQQGVRSGGESHCGLERRAIEDNCRRLREERSMEGLVVWHGGGEFSWMGFPRFGNRKARMKSEARHRRIPSVEPELFASESRGR